MERDWARKVSGRRNWTKWELREVHDDGGWQYQKLDPVA